MKRLVLLATLMLAAQAASADVFKCKAGDGTITYSQSPCADNAQVVNTNPAQPSAADAQSARDQTRRDMQYVDAANQAWDARAAQRRYSYYPPAYPNYVPRAPQSPPTVQLSNDPMPLPGRPIGR